MSLSINDPPEGKIKFREINQNLVSAGMLEEYIPKQNRHLRKKNLYLYLAFSCIQSVDQVMQNYINCKYHEYKKKSTLPVVSWRILHMNSSLSFDLERQRDEILKPPTTHHLYLISMFRVSLLLTNSAFILEVALQLWN